jgi:hypothetical protein
LRSCLDKMALSDGATVRVYAAVAIDRVGWLRVEMRVGKDRRDGEERGE